MDDTDWKFLEPLMAESQLGRNTLTRYRLVSLTSLGLESLLRAASEANVGPVIHEQRNMSYECPWYWTSEGEKANIQSE